MSSEKRTADQPGTQAFRDFARGRLDGIAKYGEILTSFGKGETGPEDFFGQSLKLGLDEGIKYAQDSISLASALFGVFSKFGPEPTPKEPGAPRRPSEDRR
jgi:hypothetical protein